MAKIRSSSCTFPNLLLSFLNFILFLLSASSIVPIIFLKMPPTSLGWAFLMISSISLFSSFIGFYSQLARFCFVTHISLLLASSIGQILGFLALFTKESSSLSLLKSKRDPKESKVLARVECGVLMSMFVVQLGVVILTCAVRSCCFLESDREVEMGRKRSQRKVQQVEEEQSMNNTSIINGDEVKGKEFGEMMKSKYGQWV